MVECGGADAYGSAVQSPGGVTRNTALTGWWSDDLTSIAVADSTARPRTRMWSTSRPMKRERPLTHDLCKSIIVGLGGSLRRVQITKVQKNTYYAELHVQRAEGLVQIDARPSDSIAIALRLSAPIFAQESLLTAVSDDDEESADPSVSSSGLPAPADPEVLNAEQLKEHLERLRPEDFGKFNL